MSASPMAVSAAANHAPPATALAPAMPVVEDGAAVARGILLMMGAVALFSTMDAIVKWLAAAGYPILMMMFFRAAIGFIPLAIYMRYAGGLRHLRTRRPVQHLVRTLIGLGSMACFFYGFSRLPLADAKAVGYAAPLLITALSVPVLGEQVGWRRWSAVAVGFVGVLIILRPGAGMLDPAALVVLAGTLGVAVNIVMTRRLTRTESNVSLVFFFSVIALAVTGLLVPAVWVTPTPAHLALFVLGGFAGGVGTILVTQAFRLAPVSIVTPFEYSSLLWGVGFGYLLWGDLPGWNMLLGAPVVIASGLYILHREARRRAERRYSSPHSAAIASRSCPGGTPRSE